MVWLKGLSGTFAKDRSGSVAIIFTLALVMLICLIGLAVDFARAQQASAEISNAIDAAALEGAKGMVEEDLTNDETKQRVQQFLNAEIGSSRFNVGDIANLHIATEKLEGAVTINVDVNVPTTFSRIFNKDNISFHQMAKTSYKVKNVELAMVLDTTGSMHDFNKLAEMKLAAGQAIDILMPPNRTALNRIALAPFAASVNAGAYAGAVSGGASADCVVERAGADEATDASGVTSPVGVTPLDPPGLVNGNCPGQEIMPMSKDAVALKASINAYSANGGTAGHIGLAWGWYLISPNWASLFPTASQPKAYGDPKSIKAILLMTDGMFNTAYLPGMSSPVLAASLCDAIKLHDVKIFTIGFELALNAPPDDVNARTLLGNCASPDGQGGNEFYDVANGADLSAAFVKIAGKLSKLRLSN